MTERQQAAAEGIQFVRLTEEVFRDFSRRHGTSDEIGRIGTHYDDGPGDKSLETPVLFGLMGCGKVCAAVCCTMTNNPQNGSHSCKLDSVIVDGQLRKRGLAGILVTRAFLDLMAEPEFDITMFHSHAVHPATVRLLVNLAFSKPALLGAPLSSIHIDDANRADFLRRCANTHRDGLNRLKLQCQFCLKRDRRAKPWCKPRKR